MVRSILGAVIGGVIVGALAFFMPHLLLGIFVFFFIVRLLHCCGRGHGYHHGHGHDRLFYMADRIRKMSDEDYAEFKTKMGGGCCDNGYHRHGHCGCGCCGSNCNCGGNCNCNSDEKCDCKTETKKEETTK